MQELNILHKIQHVNVKYAEQIVRQGLIERDIELIRRGADICFAASHELPHPFYAQKGHVKALFGLAEMLHNNDLRDELVGKASDVINSMEPCSSYEEAFFYRLKGRQCGLKGSINDALSLLLRSQVCLSTMTDPLFDSGIGVQTMISSLEAFKWRVVALKSDDNDGKIPESLLQLKNFVDEAGGMLANVSATINRLLNIISEKKPLNGGAFLRDINLIIWQMEG